MLTANTAKSIVAFCLRLGIRLSVYMYVILYRVNLVIVVFMVLFRYPTHIYLRCCFEQRQGASHLMGSLRRTAKCDGLARSEDSTGRYCTRYLVCAADCRPARPSCSRNYILWPATQTSSEFSFQEARKGVFGGKPLAAPTTHILSPASVTLLFVRVLSCPALSPRPSSQSLCCKGKHSYQYMLREKHAVGTAAIKCAPSRNHTKGCCLFSASGSSFCLCCKRKAVLCIFSLPLFSKFIALWIGGR